MFARGQKYLNNPMLCKHPFFGECSAFPPEQPLIPHRIDTCAATQDWPGEAAALPVLERSPADSENL